MKGFWGRGVIAPVVPLGPLLDDHELVIHLFYMLMINNWSITLGVYKTKLRILYWMNGGASNDEFLFSCEYLIWNVNNLLIIYWCWERDLKKCAHERGERYITRCKWTSRFYYLRSCNIKLELCIIMKGQGDRGQGQSHVNGLNISFLFIKILFYLFIFKKIS